MKIYVYEPSTDKTIHFTIPNALLVNRLSGFIIRKALQNQKKTENLPLNAAQIQMMLGILKESVKTFGHFDLVDIEESDGTIVKIRI